VHPVGITALYRKMISSFFNCLDELYYHAKFWEDVQRGPAVGAKIWCLSLFCFCLSHCEAGVLFVRGGHSLSNYCVTVCCSILIRFHRFSEVIALSDELDSLHFCC